MSVLSMNSRRQRRPNVRLGEIGDVSAAFANGVSRKTKDNLGFKKWKHDFANPKVTDCNLVCELSNQRWSEFAVSDPDLSPRFSAEMQQNRENKNPNSIKSGFGYENLNGMDVTMPQLNFGTINRKCRLMKRRGRRVICNNNVFSNAWNSKLSPHSSSDGMKEHGDMEFVGFNSYMCSEFYPVSESKDFSDRETSGTSKEAYEDVVNEPTLDAQQQCNANDFWDNGAASEDNVNEPTLDAQQQCNSRYFWKNGACYGDNDAFQKSGGDVYSVGRWLEGMGFGKYAAVFEMHEVDEDTLLLLTIEDLKEMGVLAVGPRRKLHTAIQKLREEGVSA